MTGRMHRLARWIGVKPMIRKTGAQVHGIFITSELGAPEAKGRCRIISCSYFSYRIKGGNDCSVTD